MINAVIKTVITDYENRADLFYTDVKNELIEHYEDELENAQFEGANAGWDDGFAWIKPAKGMEITIDYGDPMLPVNQWNIHLTVNVPYDYMLQGIRSEITGDDVNAALALEAEEKGVALAELTVNDYVHAMIELINDLINDAKRQLVIDAA